MLRVPILRYCMCQLHWYIAVRNVLRHKCTEYRSADKSEQGQKGTERHNPAICADIFFLQEIMPQVQLPRSSFFIAHFSMRVAGAAAPD